MPVADVRPRSGPNPAPPPRSRPPPRRARSASRPAVTRMCGGCPARTANGAPGATPMPWLASRTTAAVSSATGTHRLMPSVPPTAIPCSAERRDHRAAPLRRTPRAPARRRATECGSVSSPSSSRCSSRLLQPWPSWRSAAIRRAMSSGALSAASRRSGSVRLGEAAHVHRALRHPLAQADRLGRGDRAGRVVLDDRGRGEPHDVGEFGGAVGRQRDAGGVLRARLQVHRGDAGQRRAAPSAVIPDASTGTPTISAPRDSSRSSSGGKAGCSTATRSPKPTSTRVASSMPSIAPSTTVSSSAAKGHCGAQHARPARAAPDRRGSCQVWPRRSARRARGTGPAAAPDRARRWTDRAGTPCRGRARAGSAGWPAAAGRRPWCPAGRRCGSCRIGPAAPRPR